jgi:ketosteroid isomerase-like protein
MPKEAKMKKLSFLMGFIGFALMIGFLFLGCNKGGGSPSDVTRKLYTAIEKGDAKAVGELMTPEAAQTMTMFMEKAKGMVAAKGGITTTKETIDGDTAVVETTFKDGSSEELNLVKVDGKWKVTIEK